MFLHTSGGHFPVHYTGRVMILAVLAGLLPLAVAGGVFIYLGMTSDEPAGTIAGIAAAAGALTVVAGAAAGAALGRRADRELQDEAGRAEARVAAAHELARGAHPGAGPAPGAASIGDLGRLARALAAETPSSPGPTLRRLLLLTDESRGGPRPGREVDVNAAVRICVRALEPRGAGEPGPVLVFDPDPNVGLAPLDPDMLHIVLVGLIENAREASGPGGRVEIRTQLLGDRVLVAVRDDGEGIPHEQLARIWEPFYSTRPGAAGLGLTICKAIAEAHGGAIRAINVLPHGLEVGLTLPREPS